MAAVQQSPIILADEIIDSGTFCSIHAIIGRTDVIAKVYMHKHQFERTMRAITLIQHDQDDDCQDGDLQEYRHYVEKIYDTGTYSTVSKMTGHTRVLMYVIMPKYDINFGKYLRDYVRDNNTGLPACVTLKLARELFMALDSVSAANVIHGDVKPNNIMICAQSGAFDIEQTDSYRFILCDFGSARILGEGESTYHPAIVGTNGYIAPEIMLGLPYSYKSDIWSAMATIMTSIIGCEIFDATNSDDLIYGSGSDNAFATTWDIDDEDDCASDDGEYMTEDTSASDDSEDMDEGASEDTRDYSNSMDASGVGFAQMYAMVVEMYAIIGAPPVAFCKRARAYYVNGVPRYHPNLRPGSISTFIGNNCTLNPLHAQSIGDFVSKGLQYMMQDREYASDILEDHFLDAQ